MMMVISRSLHPFIQYSNGLPTSISKRVFLPFNIFHRQIIASDRVKVVCQVHFWRPLEFIRSTKLPNSKNIWDTIEKLPNFKHIWDKIDKFTNRFCQIGHFDVRSSAQCQFLFPSWHFAYWWVVNFATLSWVVSFAILYSVVNFAVLYWVVNFAKGPFTKIKGDLRIELISLYDLTNISWNSTYIWYNLTYIRCNSTYSYSWNNLTMMKLYKYSIQLDVYSIQLNLYSIQLNLYFIQLNLYFIQLRLYRYTCQLIFCSAQLIIYTAELIFQTAQIIYCTAQLIYYSAQLTGCFFTGTPPKNSKHKKVNLG